MKNMKLSQVKIESFLEIYKCKQIEKMFMYFWLLSGHQLLSSGDPHIFMQTFIYIIQLDKNLTLYFSKFFKLCSVFLASCISLYLQLARYREKLLQIKRKTNICREEWGIPNTKKKKENSNETSNSLIHHRTGLILSI